MRTDILRELTGQMSLAEAKVFAFAVAQWKTTDRQRTEIYMDTETVAEITDTDPNMPDLTEELNLLLGDMPEHSILEVSGSKKKFVCHFTVYGHTACIGFEKECLSLLRPFSKAYLKTWSEDVARMSTVYSLRLYELLRANTDRSGKTNTLEMSEAELMKAIGLSAEDFD